MAWLNAGADEHTNGSSIKRLDMYIGVGVPKQ